MESRRLVGLGCTSRQDGLPVHNPQPSTERGKRRHAKRNEAQKASAEKTWDRSRSLKPRTRGLRGGQISGESFTMRQAA